MDDKTGEIIDLDDFRSRKDVDLLSTTQPIELIERQLEKLVIEIENGDTGNSSYLLRMILMDLRMVLPIPDILERRAKLRENIQKARLARMRKIEKLVTDTDRDLRRWEMQGADKVDTEMEYITQRIADAHYEINSSALFIAVELLHRHFPDDLIIQRTEHQAIMMISELLEPED